MSDEVGIWNPFRRGSKPRKAVLGLRPITFSATSASELELITVPQQGNYFQAKRMVLTEKRDGAASSILTITAETVAGQNEMVGTEPSIFEAYSVVATGAMVTWRKCRSGLTISVKVKADPLPTGTDTIRAAGQLYGVIS